jgi:hypothetical protein
MSVTAWAARVKSVTGPTAGTNTVNGLGISLTLFFTLWAVGGIAVLAARWGIILDTSAGTATFWRLPFPRRRTVKSLAGIRAVSFSREVYPREGDYDMWEGEALYPIRLTGPGLEPIKLFRSRSRKMSLARACEIADFLGFEVEHAPGN